MSQYPLILLLENSYRQTTMHIISSRLQVGRSISVVMQGLSKEIRNLLLNGNPILNIDQTISVGGLQINIKFWFENAQNCSTLSAFIDQTNPMIEFKQEGEHVRLNIAKFKSGGRKNIPGYKKNVRFYLRVDIVGYCADTVELISVAKK